LGPPRWHRQLRQILPYRLPPQINQGRNAGKLRANLVLNFCKLG
jgi:hypothetical protein